MCIARYLQNLWNKFELQNKWWLIWWPNMQMLFKFQVNRMKIDSFWNLPCVDFLAYVDLLDYIDLKYSYLLNSVAWYANPLQISSQWDENL